MKIIGKIFILMHLIFVQYTQTRVLFYATDMAEREKKEFAVNQSFLVHALVEDVSGSVDIQIPELQHYKSRRVGVQINTINGVSTVKHSYMVVIEKEGAYSLGKAIVVPGKSDISQELAVVIRAQTNEEKDAEPVHNYKNNTAQQQSSSKTQNKSRPSAILTLDHHTAYVGQEITGTIRFYCDQNSHQNLKIHAFALPKVEDCRISQLSSAKRGTMIVDHKPVEYAEWSFTLCPQKEGEKKIPPFIIEYSDEDDHANTFFAPFSSFFHSYAAERIQVPAQTINVEKVPLFNGQSVAAVGQFDELMVNMTPLVINMRDASTFTLRLKGKGNSEDITFPQLENMPSQITWYQSNMRSNPPVIFDGVKEFEYILQPHATGEIKIPEQTLITFNPILKKHVILRSKQLILTVKNDGIVVCKKENSMNKKESLNLTDTKEVNKKEKQKSDHLLGLALDTISHDSIALSPIIFFLLCMVPLLYALMRWFVQHPFLIDRMKKRFYYIVAYPWALRSIKKAQKNNDYKALYEIFVRLIYYRMFLDNVDLEYNFLCATGYKKIERIDYDMWNDFCETIAALYFAHNDHQYNQMMPYIWNEALAWVDQLRRGGF
jgi:hypothetical protein